VEEQLGENLLVYGDFELGVVQHAATTAVALASHQQSSNYSVTAAVLECAVAQLAGVAAAALKGMCVAALEDVAGIAVA
jgi:hypothetical protein